MNDVHGSSLADLDPGTVEVYLLAHGWEAKKRSTMFSTWQKETPDGPAHLFLPLSKEPADYLQRLEEVIDRLALLEGSERDVVATNLRYAAADLVRIRLVGPRVGQGEIPLDDGRKLFEGAREMMWAAACAAVQPRPNFGPRAPAAATDYLDGVRLGQTERGSYVVTVISEVAPPDQQPLVPDEAAHIDIPFERQVTTRLVEALGAAQSAAARVLTEQAAIGESFEEEVERGVSANLCDAIATMGAEQAAANVQVRVDWASSRLPTINTSPAVTFEPSSLPVIREAVSALRQLGPFEDELVEGFVARLIRGQEDEIGTIVIEGTARGAKRNVHVELSDDQYGRAITAHDERRPVRVRGTLAKRGRSWVLSEAGQLRLEGSDEAQ